MKSFLLISILLISFQASAATLNDLVGTYKITSPEFENVETLTINTDGTEHLTDVSSEIKIECTGKARIDGELLFSSFSCDHNNQFMQVITLKGITSFEKFEASVFNSWYGNFDAIMHFERN